MNGSDSRSDSFNGVNETVKCVPLFVLGRLGTSRLVVGKKHLTVMCTLLCDRLSNEVYMIPSGIYFRCKIHSF